MKFYLAYLLASLVMVVLAFTESCTHLCIYGFLAIVVCQPWLALGWVLSAAGLVTLGDLSPSLVGVFAGLNLVLGGAVLFLWRQSGRNHRAGS